jgi:hypothetical protein
VVCVSAACAVAVGWVLLLGSVALQWLRELGKRSLPRGTSKIGFLNRIFIGSHSLPPSLVRRFGPSPDRIQVDTEHKTSSRPPCCWH